MVQRSEKARCNQVILCSLPLVPTEDHHKKQNFAMYYKKIILFVKIIFFFHFQMFGKKSHLQNTVKNVLFEKEKLQPSPRFSNGCPLSSYVYVCAN